MTTTCQRKNRYATQGLAEKAATRQSILSREVIKAYACSECGGFHIGHPSLKAPKAVRTRGRRR